MEQGTKRKADHDDRDSNDKRTKTKKQWQTPRKNNYGAIQARAIQPGDSGIFATCNKGREVKCIGELRDLFSEYAELLYGDAEAQDEAGGGADDIENDIEAEIAGIRKPQTAQLFTPVKLDVQCVVFFKTIAPVEPVSFVSKICEDALANPQRKRTRTAKRLAPMTLMGRASAEGLEKVALEVLAPHFHAEGVPPRTFAIRPNLRNHNTLSRDKVIKQIASLVGHPHRVDLKNYELLIIVEVYQNICGVSVVDSRFEELKRYNLAEIFDPTPKEAAPPVQKLQTAESADSTSMPDAVPQESAADIEQKPAVVETSAEAVMDTS